MYVDANGQVHDGTEPESFNPLEQGHRLSGDGTLHERLERAADNAAAVVREELAMNITVPTAVKVAAGVAVVGVVALPLGALLLSWIAARKAGSAAAAAAPYIAEAGPVIIAAVPEAAPVVAAAGVVTAVRKARAAESIAADSGEHAAQIVGAIRTLPRADAPRAIAEELQTVRGYAGQLLGALRTITPEPKSLRVEVDGVPVRAELMQRKEQA